VADLQKNRPVKQKPKTVVVVVVIVVVVVAAAAVAIYHRVMRKYTDKPSQSVFIYFRMKSLKKTLKSDTFGKLTHDLQTSGCYCMNLGSICQRSRLAETALRRLSGCNV